MENLVLKTIGGWGGRLVEVEEPELLQTLLRENSLPREALPDAAEEGSAVIALYADATDFESGSSEQLETYLRSAYLLSAEPERLVLADRRPLFDLLRESLPEVREKIPQIELAKLLKAYSPRLLALRPSLTAEARTALLEGRDFCGMFSVCGSCGEPSCYATYAVIRDGVCLVEAVIDGSVSLRLYPFQIVKRVGRGEQRAFRP